MQHDFGESAALECGFQLSAAFIHDFTAYAAQPSHSVDRSWWPAKMATIELWIT